MFESCCTISRERTGEFQILISVIFFALSHVAARDAMLGNKGIGPITFAACCSVVSTLIIYIVMPCMQRTFHVQVDQHESERRFSEPAKPSTRWELLYWGFICGCANFSGSALGQIGLVTVTVGKAGFITGMYVVFIPIVEYILPGYGIQVSYY